MKFLLEILDALFGKLLSLFIIRVSRLFKIKYTSRNLWGSLGHTLAEMDYFLRLKKSGQINKNIKIVFLSNENKMSKVVYKMFQENFIFLITSPYLEFFLKKRVLWPNQDLCLDIGLNSLSRNSSGNITQREMLDSNISYYKMISSNENFKPFKNFKIDQDLINFLGFDLHKTKYIVVQIKQGIANATATKTDPLTYIKTIKYFKDKNYKVIFAGKKENFPGEFENLEIINYNNFKYQSIKTDIDLVSKASLVICGASGFGLLPSLLDIPCVWANSWQVGFPVSGRYVVQLPLKFIDKKTNKFVSYDKIINHHLEIDKYDFKSFHLYGLIPNNDEEIFEAALEAISLKKKYSDFSDNYKNFIKKCDYLPIRYASSRISERFILNNMSLFK